MIRTASETCASLTPRGEPRAALRAAGWIKSISSKMMIKKSHYTCSADRASATWRMDSWQDSILRCRYS